MCGEFRIGSRVQSQFGIGGHTPVVPNGGNNLFEDEIAIRLALFIVRFKPGVSQRVAPTRPIDAKPCRRPYAGFALEYA